MVGECVPALIHKFWVKVTLSEDPQHPGVTAASQCLPLVVAVTYFSLWIVLF